MNIQSNPWSFVPGDMNVAALAAANSMVQNADGTVTMTTNAAATYAVGNYLTIYGITNVAGWNGFYVVVGVTSNTVYTLRPAGNPLGTLAAGNGGTAALNQYNANVRIEDMSWQNPSAAGQLLEIRDRNGNLLWSATATGAGSQNRGKLFWCSGITITVFGSGVVLVTVN